MILNVSSKLNKFLAAWMLVMAFLGLLGFACLAAEANCHHHHCADDFEHCPVCSQFSYLVQTFMRFGNLMIALQYLLLVTAIVLAVLSILLSQNNLFLTPVALRVRMNN